MGGWCLEFQVLDTGAITPAPDDDLVIGARSQNGAIVSHSNIELGEVIIYDKALSDEDVYKVQGYLAHKWGLTESMPVNHPHKFSKPVFENRPQLDLSSPLSLLVGRISQCRSSYQSFFGPNLGIQSSPGIQISTDSSWLEGVPSSVGTFISTFETSNSAGSLSTEITIDVKKIFEDGNFSSEIEFRLFGKHYPYRFSSLLGIRHID